MRVTQDVLQRCRTRDQERILGEHRKDRQRIEEGLTRSVQRCLNFKRLSLRCFARPQTQQRCRSVAFQQVSALILSGVNRLRDRGPRDVMLHFSGEPTPARVTHALGLILGESNAADHFTANTQMAPPSGTSGYSPGNSVFNRACMARESMPQPDWTATYCLPSTINDDGCPIMPEFVGNSHKSWPVDASKA